MRKLNLRAASTFFDSKGKQNTCISPSLKIPYQPDHILIPKHQLNRVKNIKRKMDGAPRDHAALTIKISLPHRHTIIPPKRKKKINRKIDKINNNILRQWNRIISRTSKKLHRTRPYQRRL